MAFMLRASEMGEASSRVCERALRYIMLKRSVCIAKTDLAHHDGCEVVIPYFRLSAKEGDSPSKLQAITGAWQRQRREHAFSSTSEHIARFF